MDWGFKNDVLPTLGSGAGPSSGPRYRNAGLAPLNPSSVHLPKAPEEQDLPRQPKSSHGSRDVHRQAGEVSHREPRLGMAATGSNLGQQLHIRNFASYGG